VSDVVELEVPLHPRYGSTVRAVAASVCAELGFSVDDIDDLRLGVNEAVSVLADVDDPTGGRLRVRLESGDGAVTVVCSRHGIGERLVAADIDVLARRILDAVVDEYTVDADGAIIVVKRLATVNS
jgi:serine/threonine-protein kinase RsbW